MKGMIETEQRQEKEAGVGKKIQEAELRRHRRQNVIFCAKKKVGEIYQKNRTQGHET
jgi:hypothetical protein